MMDAERVMQFLVNHLKVRGPIGIYGRSIGGIAASHISSKFRDLVDVFIGDRTMGDFSQVVKKRISNNRVMSKLYGILACYNMVDNS